MPDVPGSIKDWKERTNEGIDGTMSPGKAAPMPHNLLPKSTPTPSPLPTDSPRELQRKANEKKLREEEGMKKRRDTEEIRKRQEEIRLKGLEKEVPGP